MKDELKKVSCDPKCGFSVISHDYKELIRIVKDHARIAHKLAMTDESIEVLMRYV